MKKVKVMVDDSKSIPGNLRLVESVTAGSQTRIYLVDQSVWAYYTNTLQELSTLYQRITRKKDYD